MNSSIKYIITFLIGIITFISANPTFAGNPDSIKQTPSISSEKILNLKTVWSGSTNAAGLQFFHIQNKIGKAYINYNFEKGNFRKFQEEKELNEIGFCTNGYVKLNKWKFYGDFNYFKSKNKGVKWVDVMETDSDNPYTLGDSVGGTYFKEYFKMRGKAAYQINNLFTFGFDVKYKAGVGARRKDPRPENLITSFNILPGLVFNFNKIKLGANFIYESGKEDIELNTVTDYIYSFYHFKGLGVYTLSTEKDVHSSESNLFGGGLQFNYNGNRIINITEVNFYKKATDIKRGKTYPLQIVLLEKYGTSATSTFMFYPSEKTVNKLSLFFNDKHIYGHEPVVEPKLEQVSYQWKTVEKYTLYWYNEQEFGANYSYYKLKNTNHFNWGANILGKVITSKSSYYFVPEANEQTLNYFIVDGAFEKEFQIKLNTVIISLNGSYRKDFDSSFKIVTEETLLETIKTDFVEHDFDYYNSQLIQFGGSIQFGRMVEIYKSPVQMFLSADYKRMISQMNDTNRNVFSLKVGVNF